MHKDQGIKGNDTWLAVGFIFCLFFGISSVAQTGSGAPQLTSINPATVTAGSTGFTLAVAGNNFANNAVVLVNGNARPTTYVSAIQLRATIPSSDLTAVGQLNVSVSNPGVGGGVSLPLSLAITSTPIPLLGSISPAKVVAGGPSFTLIIDGSNFASDSVAQINGTSRVTTVVNSNQLATTLTDTDISASGFPNMTVFSPSTGVTSNATPLTVFRYGDLNFDNTVDIVDLVVLANYLAGNLTLLDPITADLNLDGFIDLTDQDILGNYLAGNIRTLPASLPPLIYHISPGKIVAGGSSLTITVNGKHFPHNSVVQINGASRATTFVTPLQLTATILASDIAASGFLNVTVLAPSTGTISNTSRLTVFRYGDLNFDNTIDSSDLVVLVNYLAGNLTLLDPITADLNLDGFIDSTDQDILANYLAGNIPSLPASLPPSIQNISPGKIVAGSPSFNLTVNGKDFPHNSLVQINGASRSTILVTTRQLTATILNSDIAASGFPNVTVLSPSTGATSNAAPLTVFRYCDLNFDNVIDISDTVLFANYLASRVTLLDPSPADVNLDGHIDILDLFLCENYLAGNIHSLPVAAGDFSISASPASMTITAGDSASYTISTAGLNGSSSNVELSFNGLPTDNASLSPPVIIGNGTSTLTVSTTSATPAGFYSITITGTSGAFTHSTTVTLSVDAPLPPDTCGATRDEVGRPPQPCLSN
jgi:hypothetical protein